MDGSNGKDQVEPQGKKAVMDPMDGSNGKDQVEPQGKKAVMDPMDGSNGKDQGQPQVEADSEEAKDVLLSEIVGSSRDERPVCPHTKCARAPIPRDDEYMFQCASISRDFVSGCARRAPIPRDDDDI